MPFIHIFNRITAALRPVEHQVCELARTVRTMISLSNEEH